LVILGQLALGDAVIRKRTFSGWVIVISCPSMVGMVVESS